tara:strand:+ start:343 stop:903 length:561 start_codon:yes stop_codon:yes gene_type:complete
MTVTFGRGARLSVNLSAFTDDWAPADAGQIGGLMRRLLLLALISAPFWSATAGAAIGVGYGYRCDEVMDDVRREWMVLRTVMAPQSVRLTRLKTEHLNCLDPLWIRESIERTTAMASRLRCFSDPEHEGLGFCCDLKLEQCTQLKRELIPIESRTKMVEKKAPPPHKSAWVRPPTEDDQWQSVDEE